MNFCDGGTAIVAFGRQSMERIGIILRAWGILNRREVRSWERTSLPAEYWYDGRKKRMCRYDDPISHDILEMLLPLSVAIEWRKKAVAEMQRQGRTASEIAQLLSMPLPGVKKMLQDSAAGVARTTQQKPFER